MNFCPHYNTMNFYSVEERQNMLRAVITRPGTGPEFSFRTRYPARPEICLLIPHLVPVHVGSHYMYVLEMQKWESAIIFRLFFKIFHHYVIYYYYIVYYCILLLNILLYMIYINILSIIII